MKKKIFTMLVLLMTAVTGAWAGVEPATTTDLASITGDYTAQDGEILTGTLGANVKISIADGATVTLLNANINGDKTFTTAEHAGLTCLGDATITIVGTNSVSGTVDIKGYGYPAIYVPSGKTLIINGTGSLMAQSSKYAAAIGARRESHCGNIEIQSGKITAIADGERGAGIGGAHNANCGNITISGGIVTAVGSSQCAGIGGGRRGGSTDAGHCGDILISGGVVSATSGEDAAAIGGGRGNNNSYKSNCGTITITNTVLKVYADQGGGSKNTIGAGYNGNDVTVIINGNTGVINDDPYTYGPKEDGEIVVDYINAIGTVVYTQECKDKIDIARELYDKLEAAQKDLVSNYSTLTDAEAAYAALVPAEPGTAVLNADGTEAVMEMPTYDVTVDYELVRDMTVQMTTQVGVGNDGYRIRIKKDNQTGKFVPAEMTPQAMAGLITVTDDIEQQTLTNNTDYTVSIFAVDDNDQPTGTAIAFADLEPGRYVAFATAKEGTIYDGQTLPSNIFKLFVGYEVEVGAESFATFYKDEKLTVEESSTTGELYTISSVSADEAVLSAQIGVAPANTPLLVYNSGSEKKTILLIPTEDEADSGVTYANEFKGTLVASTIAASTNSQTNYALNGKQFVWVKNALSIAANKCWLEVVNSNARAISILFGEATGISTAVTTVPADGDWYDLNGRKVTAPTRKGVYIHNGKKVVIK